MERKLKEMVKEVIDGIHNWVYLGQDKSINGLSIKGYSILCKKNQD
ncbi:MAG: hypothetical protein NUV32_10480 [Exilispira sp.]|jgi:hypothetical protein|nr:hypothetical protein [Exilispira sp.]